MTNGPADDDELLLPAEAVALTGVDRTTLARWARTGVVPVVLTAKGRRQYRRGDLLALVAARPARSDPPGPRPAGLPAGDQRAPVWAVRARW